jgi:hypothetical protein
MVFGNWQQLSRGRAGLDHLPEHLGQGGLKALEGPAIGGVGEDHLAGGADQLARLARCVEALHQEIAAAPCAMERHGRRDPRRQQQQREPPRP